MTMDYKVEAFLGAAWVDLSAKVRRGSINLGVSRFAGVFAKADVGRCTVELSNADGAYDPTNTSSPYTGQLLPRTPLRITGPTVADTSYLRLGGVGYAWTADTAGLSITGDLDLRIELTPDPDQPARDFLFDGSSPIYLIHKENSYSLRYVPLLRQLVLEVVQSSGTTFFTHTLGLTEANDPFFACTRTWVRAAIDLTNGANSVATFYVSTNGTSWTTLGTSTLGVIGALKDTTERVHIGARRPSGSNADEWEGAVCANVYRVVILSGIAGTSKATVDFTNLALGASSSTDDNAQVWACYKGAAIMDGTGRLPLFTGFVETWQPEFPVAGHDATVTVRAVDGRYIVAGAHFSIGGSEASDDDHAGRRVAYLLDAIGWSATLMRLEVGTEPIWLQDLFGDEAGAALQLVADNDVGELYVDPLGRFTFRDRHAVHRLPRSRDSQATFGDGGGAELPYLDLRLVVDAQQIVNQARVTRVDGGSTTAGEQVVTDAASQVLYGQATFAKDGLLVETDARVVQYGYHVLALFAGGEYRFDTLVVEALTATAERLARTELGDRITCKARPPYGGTRTRQAFVRGIQHDWTEQGTPRWTTTMQLQDAERFAFFVLDSSAHGVLDTDRLAF